MDKEKLEKLKDLAQIRNLMLLQVQVVEEQIFKLLPTWRERADQGYKVGAVQAYREEFGVTLSEAYRAVTAYLKPEVNRGPKLQLPELPELSSESQ